MCHRESSALPNHSPGAKTAQSPQSIFWVRCVLKYAVRVHDVNCAEPLLRVRYVGKELKLVRGKFARSFEHRRGFYNRPTNFRSLPASQLLIKSATTAQI